MIIAMNVRDTAITIMRTRRAIWYVDVRVADEFGRGGVVKMESHEYKLLQERLEKNPEQSL